MSMRGLKMLCLALLLSVSTAASAHRFHFGMTDISYNPRTESTEIVHTYTAHDIDALLLNLYGRQFDLSDADDQAVLRTYVERHFWLAGQDGKKLPVTWVGMTADGPSIVIYQELANTPLAAAATVHQGVLVDFLAEQVNTVNLSEGGAVRSLTFMRKTLEQSAR
jgi:hypothetical protein